MKRVLVLLISISLLLVSCKSELDVDIHAAVRDGKVSFDEWNTIKEDALVEKRFIDENGVDVSELQNYIGEYAEKNIRGLENIEFEFFEEGKKGAEDNTIYFKFFLERSGSMIPYDDRQTTGQFKSAITGLLNSVPNNSDPHNLMFIVNNMVTPFLKTFKDFVQSSNIMEDTRGYGDVGYTEYTCIFDSVLNRTGDNEVSILVSDMIYSTRHQYNIPAYRIMNEAHALTKNIFSGHDDKDILIIKLNADYNGYYYPFNTPNNGFNYTGMRPYYMMIVAKSDVMHRLFNEPKYRDFCNFKHLNGYENYYCFTRKCDNPDYSILFKNSSRFAPEKGHKNNGKQIHNVNKLKCDRKTGETRLIVAVDMSDIITEPNYLTNIDNYQVQSKSGFVVTDVTTIDKSDMPVDIYHYVPSATHLLELTTSENIINETVCVSLKNEFPSWISKSSTDDDRDRSASDFATTTFAFKSMMDGIYEAFYSTTETPVYYKLFLNIKH